MENPLSKQQLNQVRKALYQLNEVKPRIDQAKQAGLDCTVQCAALEHIEKQLQQILDVYDKVKQELDK